MYVLRNFTWYWSLKIYNILLLGFYMKFNSQQIQNNFLNLCFLLFSLLYVKQISQCKIVYRDWEKHLGEWQLKQWPLDFRYDNQLDFLSSLLALHMIFSPCPASLSLLKELKYVKAHQFNIVWSWPPYFLCWWLDTSDHRAQTPLRFGIIIHKSWSYFFSPEHTLFVMIGEARLLLHRSNY